MEDAVDCLMSFPDFLYAFQTQFFYEGNNGLKGLKLLKFENIVSLQVAKIMCLYKNGQLPESFNNMFFTGEEIHNYNTRNKIFFRLPSCRTIVRKFSLRFQGPKIFNTINDEIKNSLNLKEFTSKLKSTFLD